MELLADMKNGLGVLEPFLNQYDFELDCFEYFHATSGKFTLAKYKNRLKEFILGYDFSIGQIVYQFDKLSVGHDFYLDHLGYTNEKKFTDVHREDKLLSFRCLRHDFDFLIDDFFRGECIKLKEISTLQDNIILEYDKVFRQEFNQSFDNLMIEKARNEFRMKNFEKCLEIYERVCCKESMNDLDFKIVEYSGRHIED
jgi:hypothetical protein